MAETARQAAGRIDPISLEIQWSRLVSIMDEVDAAVVRTAFSTIVGESRDFGCVLLDRDGHSLAQSQLSSPPFTVELPRTAKAILSIFEEDMVSGDVFLQNDPWIGTGHLPDISIIMPVFYGGCRVAFVAVAAHVSDIGGRLDFLDARDLYEEGLRILPCRIVKAGKPNEELFDIIRANVRGPEMVLGDINAIIGAELVGARRLASFLEEYGAEQFRNLGQEILNRSEQAMRRALAELPDGTYPYEHVTDGPHGPVRIRVTVSKTSDTIRLDFTGTSPELPDCAINCTENASYAAAVYPIKCSLAPNIPNNEGLYRPITFHAPKGCLLNTTFPHPVKARSKVSMQVHMAIYGALADAMPRKVQAGSGGFWAVHINGIDKEGKALGAHILPWGGKGAVDGMDGHPTMPFPSNGTVTPTEIVENRVPIRIQYKRLLCDSAGPGKYRGGLGQEISFMCIADYPLYIGVRPDKMDYPPPGINGGQPGARGSFTVNGARGSYGTTMPIIVQDGDEVVIRIPGGGGYGDPSERSPDAVAHDVLLGFVSAECAGEVYGVEFSTDGSVNDDATASLRQSAQEKRMAD